MIAFQSATDLAADAPGRAELSRDWSVWGPNGGYLAAIALRAVGRVAPSDHRPATLSCQFVSMAQPGPATVDVEARKIGRGACLYEVQLSQKDSTFMCAQVWTTGRQDGPMHQDPRIPAVPPPGDLLSLDERVGDKQPALWRQFDIRPVHWVGPEQPHPDGAAVTEWMRYRDDAPTVDPFLDCARLLVPMDLMVWPAHHRGLTERPGYIAPSLDLSVWFHVVPSDVDWMLVDVRAQVAARGLIYGASRIWSLDGRLLASGGAHLMTTAKRS